MANKSVKELPISYVKSPFDLIKAPADWNILESKILIAVSIQLQERFQRFHDSEISGQLSLFSESEFSDSPEVELRIPIKEINITPNHYDQVGDACKRISSMIVPVISMDKNKLRITEYRQLFVAGYNNEGRGDITIKIHKSVADTYFRGGSFALHLRSIANNCRCSYTPHLYMYLSKFRDYKGEATLSYEELRKMMGMYKLNTKGESIKINKKTGAEEMNPEGMYPRFKDFKKRVLEPAKAELDRLFEQQMVDISFVYQTLYADGATTGRGNPHKIHFTIIKNWDNKIMADMKKALTPQEQKAIEKWNELLSCLGVKNIEGVQPIGYDWADAPLFEAESEEAWENFYRSPETAKYWIQVYGNIKGERKIVSSI